VRYRFPYDTFAEIFFHFRLPGCLFGIGGSTLASNGDVLGLSNTAELNCPSGTALFGSYFNCIPIDYPQHSCIKGRCRLRCFCSMTPPQIQFARFGLSILGFHGDYRSASRSFCIASPPSSGDIQSAHFARPFKRRSCAISPAGCLILATNIVEA
jgi:hypothetical protein